LSYLIFERERERKVRKAPAHGTGFGLFFFIVRFWASPTTGTGQAHSVKVSEGPHTIILLPFPLISKKKRKITRKRRARITPIIMQKKKRSG